MLTQSGLLDVIYLFCLFTPFGSLYLRMEVKSLNTGHDFSRDFPAAVTTMFYAAADDYSFGKQKVKIHEQRFTKLSELKRF